MVIILGICAYSEPVFAEIEVGKNYNIELLSTNFDGTSTYLWTSMPERIVDYIDSENPVYVNYLFSEDTDKIYFESMYNTIIFDKPTNTIELYAGGKLGYNQSEMKLSHSIKEAINGTNIWMDILVGETPQTTYTINEYDIQIISSIGDFKTIYDIGLNGFEYTYQYTNNDTTKINQKYGFTTTCTGVNCDDTYIDGIPIILGETKTKSQVINHTILVGNKYLDLKNDQHDYFLELKHTDNDTLVIDFTDSKKILHNGQTITVDSIFLGVASYSGHINGDTSCTTGVMQFITSAMSIGRHKAPYYDCYRGYAEWDISSLSLGVIIEDTVFKFERETPSLGGRVCDVYSMEYQPSTSTSLQVTIDAKDGTEYVNADNFCNDVSATNQLLDLGSLADSNLQDTINVSQVWWAIGISFDDESTPSEATISRITTVSGTPNPTLQITYTGYPFAVVDDLEYTSVDTTTVNLSWSAPEITAGNLTGYQINYTTPYGTPNTIITNNTGTISTTSQISDLTHDTAYSFRIGAYTGGYMNDLGNIINVTTLEDYTFASFEVGSFDVNATNSDMIPILFSRTDIDDTSLYLNVTYPNSYNLSCEFEYKFANTRQTYTNLSNNTISENKIESSFLFENVDNEIINVHCWDENSNNDGSYIITQSTFPLLQQIQNFRSGEYGTDGQFGAIDLITLLVIILSMIGFNRLNESVGAIFNIVLLGSLAYFEIIELPTVIFGAIALVLMLVITTTKKV